MMTAQHVSEALDMSVRTLWRMVAAGKFPQPVRYSRKLVRWKTADVLKYVRELQ